MSHSPEWHHEQRYTVPVGISTVQNKMGILPIYIVLLFNKKNDWTGR